MQHDSLPIGPVLLTVEQACKAGNFGRTKFYEFVAAGLIRTVRIGSGERGGVRVPTSEMAALPDRLRERDEAAA